MASQFITEEDLDKIDAATKAAINSLIASKLSEIEEQLSKKTNDLAAAQAEVQRLSVEYKGLGRKLEEAERKLSAVTAVANGSN